MALCKTLAGKYFAPLAAAYTKMALWDRLEMAPNRWVLNYNSN